MKIDVAREGGIQTIRFNRPEKKNAITTAMYEALTQALEGGDWSEGVRAHVIAGLPGAFSAGNDMNDFLAFADNGALGEPVLRFLRTIATLQKPVIAAVDGLAVGIGTTLLLHCDLVYASPEASFHTPFLDLGLVPEAASSLLMPRRMGYARAFEMLCLGIKYDAGRALAAGLVNEIIPGEELESYVRQVALQLASKPPEALAAGRKLLRGSPENVMARIEEEAVLFAERLSSSEAREAFRSFLEKRPADFASSGAE